MTTSTPVALLIFNRPEHTQQVFDRVAAARPPRLLVVGDGPRPDRPDDVALVREARAVIDQVDWPCEVSTCYADVNLGCGVRIASGLDWVFEQVPEAILLEDDCVPDPTFFRFCEELLSRYRDDPRVQMIGGCNVLEPDGHVVDSYCFSRAYSIWGWATWARAWRHYDFEMRTWPELRQTRWLENHLRNDEAAAVARSVFDATYDGRIKQWDFQWVLSGWLCEAVSIVPRCNLVTNIGHGEAGTHLRDAAHPLARLPVRPMEFPLTHPLEVGVDEVRDEAVWRLAAHRQRGVPPGPGRARAVNALRRALPRIGRA